MALREVREIYSGARIDVDDMTLTEFGPDDCEVYSLWDILERRGWRSDRDRAHVPFV